MVSNVLMGSIMGVVVANLALAGAIAIGATNEIKIFGDKETEHVIYIEEEKPRDKIGYIKIEGIEGESTDEDHEGWSEILSFGQGINRGETWNSGGRTYGGVETGDITLIKDIDRSSPLLSKSVCCGEVLGNVTIHIIRNEDEKTYLVYEISSVEITSITINSDNEYEDEPVTEEVTLNFEGIRFSYDELDQSGSSMGNIEYSWNTTSPAQ